MLVFDALDAPGLDERIRALGEPEAVVQLLDRHERDCALVAARLGVPHWRLRLGELPGAELRRIVWSRFWKEAAFWAPEHALLIVGDALGTRGYFTGPGERLGLHPLLRLRPPPSLRAIARCLAPRHVLCGHGAGIHGDEAALALEEALTTARRRIPRWLVSQMRRKR